MDEETLSGGITSSELRKNLAETRGSFPRVVEKQLAAFLVWLFQTAEDGWPNYSEFKQQWKLKVEQLNRVMRKEAEDKICGRRLFPSPKEKRPAGRPSVSGHVVEQVRQLLAQKQKPRAIAETLGIGQSTVYKLRNQFQREDEERAAAEWEATTPEERAEERAEFRRRLRAIQERQEAERIRAEERIRADGDGE